MLGRLRRARASANDRTGPRDEFAWVRRLAAVLAAIALAMLVLAAVVHAPPYGGYVECRSGSYQPSHNCYLGQHLTSVFTDNNHDSAHYSVCVGLVTEAPRCSTGRTGVAGKAHRQALTLSGYGSYVARWFAHGRRVRRWHFKVRPQRP